MTTRVVKNSAFMGVGAILGGGLLLATIVAVARALGPADFGDFIVALTFASLFQAFADGGIVQVTIRDVAQAPERCGDILAKTHGLLWIITGVALLVLAVTAELFLTGAPHRALCYGMGGAALATLHASLFAGIARAHEDMGLLAALGLGHKALVLGLVLGAAAWDLGLPGVAYAHLLATVAHALVQRTIVARRYAPAAVRFDRQHTRYLLREALPLGAGFVIRRTNLHVSTILLTVLAGSATVGLYNSAYRFLQMVEVGALTLSSVLFPVFAKLFPTDPSGFRRLYGTSTRFLLLLGAPVAGLAWVFGDPVITLLYGSEYAAAGSVLRIIGAALLFLVPGTLFHSVFVAAGRQSSFMRLSLVSIAVQVCAGVVLIPRMQATGAAIATLLTEAATFVVGALLLRRLGVSTTYASTFGRVFAAVALPSLVLAGFPWSGDPPSSLVLLLGAATHLVLFLVLVVLLGVVRPSELREHWARRRGGIAHRAPTSMRTPG